MTDHFADQRAEIQRRRQALSTQEEALLLACDRGKRLLADEEALARVFDPENPEHVRLRNQLRSQQGETERRVTGLREDVERARRRLGERLEAFLPLSDPRTGAEQLSDQYPVLLLPLRLETRFAQRPDPDGTRHELWVRVYPDDCAVDTFESYLSEAEVRHARTFWARMWRAGDDETERRAAWRALVAGHGSGRSLWITQQYRPLDEAAQPARPPGTVILVIPTTTPLPDAEQPAVATFWEQMWRAEDDAEAAAAAAQALEDTVGAPRAAEIVERYRPFNLDDPPPPGLTRPETALVVAPLLFATDEDVEVRRRAWSTAPRVDLLPDRLVLLGYVDGELTLDELGNPIPSPLIVGPDPQAEPGTQLRQDGDGLDVGDDLRWMVDFDDAVAKGMGFRVTLSASAYARGFDRLLVAGLRLSSDEQDGRAQLESLLEHHQSSRTGLALLPQGAATNNTEDRGADFRAREDADASYPIMAGDVPPFDPDPSQWRDGQYLAYWLGVDAARFARVPYAGGTDVGDAQAMNAALWPGTLGYWMDTMLSSVFDDRTVERTSRFFTAYVSGRGMVPGMRIGKQPYGVLPTTAHHRLAWPGGIDVTAVGETAGELRYLTGLHEVLMRASGVWDDLTGSVSHVGKQGDPHQILLDVLGLHPTSAEYYSRNAESLAQVVNSLNLQGFGGFIAALLIAAALANQGVDILSDHGYDIEASGRPQLLDKYFFAAATKLGGDLIDDQPLSETDPVRPYTTDGRNYLTWLADAGRASLETIRRQEGFIDGRAPTALLYLTLRHALTLGYYETGVRLYTAAELLSPEALQATRREANFVHVTDRPSLAESRWKLLYQRQPEVTGGREDLLVADYIPSVLGEAPEAARLQQQLAALDHLAGLPTAKLERVFAEHLDTCGYRFDAWLQGLVHQRLTRMRESGGQGLYLGAYGWLEDLRPDERQLELVELADEELQAIFQPVDEPPLQRDPANAGYVHAPSLNHAVTAAVLRNGYLTNATRGEPGPFAVNLSSERVRRALAVVEGIQGGQSLGALLGYQFERGLHDLHGQAEVDRFIYPLRKAFPLRADRLADTTTDPSISIESIEARNVLDGVALVEHVQRTSNDAYPFGLPSLPEAGADATAAIDAEVARLRDTHDAVADLGLAEGVHQVLQGNYDRAAASLDAFSQGQLPPLPDVVQTPRSGIGLTHRVGLHLRPGLPPPGAGSTPRAAAEPAVNDWLASLLPQPRRVGVVVRLADGTGLASERTVTQEDLGLEPIDLLYLLTAEGEQAMTALDDHITRHLAGALRPDGTITIAYTERITGMVSFFEAAAFVGHLRALLLTARPLRATDLALPNEAAGMELPPPTYRTERLVRIRDDLTPPLDALRTLVAELTPLLDDPVAHEDELVDHVDDRLTRYADALATLGLYGLPQTGFGFALDWKRGRYRALLRKVEDLRARWQDRLNQAQALLNAYDALPLDTPDEERFTRLEEIERLVAVELTTPRPPDPAVYRSGVEDRRDAFAVERTAYGNILATMTSDLAALLAAVRTESADLTEFDFVRLDLDDDVAEIVRFSQDLLSGARSLVADVEARQDAVDDALVAYDAAASTASREEAATRAAQLLLGEDVLFLPEFTLPAASGDELQNAYDAETALLNHLRTVVGSDFPVDDWLYGVARVRPQMGHWEAVTMLADALAGTELDLRPSQLPYLPDDHWLALPYPDGYRVEHDRLLFTAHYATPFRKAGAQCGLLLDEWTEVIPAPEETTGITFHYDRPNSEPPNVMLLVAPPVLNGRWDWADLVDTLHSTLEQARRRAVEPDHVDATSYARFLPATISAATYSPITIALNLAVNNHAYSELIGADDA